MPNFILIVTGASLHLFAQFEQEITGTQLMPAVFRETQDYALLTYPLNIALFGIFHWKIGGASNDFWYRGILGTALEH